MANKTTLPVEKVTAIGRVVANFQDLEFTVVGLIWILATPDESIGQRITACVPFSKLCELLTSIFLYQVKAPATVKRFETLMSKARDVNTERNRVVHSWWSTDIPGGTPSRLKPKAKGASYDSADIDLNALAASISQLADDFDQFIDELYAAKLIARKPGISL